MTVLRVTWLDSGLHADYGWDSRERYMENIDAAHMVATTVGILMDESDDVIALALTRDEANDQWLGVQAIYKNNIISRQELA